MLCGLQLFIQCQFNDHLLSYFVEMYIHLRNPILISVMIFDLFKTALSLLSSVFNHPHKCGKDAVSQQYTRLLHCKRMFILETSI